MLILKRLAAGALAFAGMMAAYLADARAASDSAETTAMVVALALGCFALAAVLAWNWGGARTSRRAGPIAGLMLAALAAATLAAPRAAAESASDRAICTPSVLRLCPTEALSADREGAKRCLFRNISRASLACQAVVHANPIGDASRPGRRLDGVS